MGSVFNYTYDGAGNLLSFDRWNGSAVETVHYKYNGANQIQCVDSNNNNQCGDTGDIAYTYDAYGNLTDDGASTYTYDAANRLISVVKGGVTTSYTYDGDGNRLSQTVGTTTTTYVIDTATPLTMVLSETTGGVTTYYWQGLDLLGQSDGTNAKYLEYDGLGSVRQVTDGAGTLQYTGTFDPYGNLYSSSGINPTKYAFTGEAQDTNGLLFLRARYYNAASGRFFQTDPSRKEQNPFAYAAGNPVMFTDPSGLASRSMAVQVAHQWAKVSWAEWIKVAAPWLTLDDDKLMPVTEHTNYTDCQDCATFASYVLWQAGFEMQGTKHNTSDGWYWQGDGWWANLGQDSNKQGGGSSTWWHANDFVNYWTGALPVKPEHLAIPVIMQEWATMDDVPAIVIYSKYLWLLKPGDVVAYDHYDDGKTNWDHVAIITSNGMGNPQVTGRGVVDLSVLKDDDPNNDRLVCDPNKNSYDKNFNDQYLAWNTHTKIIGLMMPYDSN